MKSANTSPEEQYTQHTTTSNHHKQNSNSDKPPITNEEIKNTPFRIINLPTEGWFITLGNQRIGNLHSTKQQALEELNQNTPWQMICNVIVTLAEQIQPLINNKPKNNETN